MEKLEGKYVRTNKEVSINYEETMYDGEKVE